MSTAAVDVLLVEDNPNDAELMQRALGRHGLADRVWVVRDGAEALEFLFATGRYTARAGGPSPRVVLLDLKLPKVDGVEVLRRIRADDETRSVPVVVLTSSAEERDVIQSYALGVNSYIVKPVEFEVFAQTVADLGSYWMLLNRTPR